VLAVAARTIDGAQRAPGAGDPYVSERRIRSFRCSIGPWSLRNGKDNRKQR
jgi:hypothetical protein